MAIEWKARECGCHEHADVGPFTLARDTGDEGRIAVLLADGWRHVKTIRRSLADEAEAAALAWIRDTCTATLTALDTEAT